MTRLILFLVAVLVITGSLSWFAERPGTLLIVWQGYEIETSVFRAIVILGVLASLALLCWSILRQVWLSPAWLGRYLRRQRQRRGLDALSSGMIAIGAGDRTSAIKFTQLARKSLPNQPLTHLLRAQTAQLTGDRATSKRIFEAMLGSPDTELLGLRGLYLEAIRMKEHEAARQFAQRALNANPALSWPAEAVFQHQCQLGDWNGALTTLATLRRHSHIEKSTAGRRRAVLLAARAQSLEDRNPETALALTLESHGLAKDLVPAAAIAGRLLASRGNTAKAAKVLRKTWSMSPHPELATAYAHARTGDSPRDRLDRVKQLSALSPHSDEGPIAVAVAAIEAHQFDDARHALAPLLDDRLTQRVATLMARIEGEEHGDKGRVREWLARAVNAQRDPAWTADGIVSEDWIAFSPVSGRLDAFQWRVPVERAPGDDIGKLAAGGEALVAAIAATKARDTQGVRDPEGHEPSRTIEAHPKGNAAAAAAASVSAAPVPAAANREPEQSHVGLAARATKDAAGDNTGAERLERPPVAARDAGKTGQHRDEEKHAAKSNSQGAKAGDRKYRSARREEPPVFVSPRAPDDPGTEAGEQDPVQPPLKPYGAAS